MLTSSKTLVSAAALLALALRPAPAAAQVVVDSVVETDDAVFFSPHWQPDVVWFIPRMMQRLDPVEPVIAGVRYYRAVVALRSIAAVDLAALDVAWAGKVLVPYVARPRVECGLRRLPEIRTSRQEVRAFGRDVSAADVAPICQFLLRPSPTGGDAAVAELQAQAAARTLLDFPLSLSLAWQREISWARLHQRVRAELGTAVIDEGSARAALARAAGMELPDLTPAEMEALLEEGLVTLFVPAAALGTVTVLPFAPWGVHEVVRPFTVSL